MWQTRYGTEPPQQILFLNYLLLGVCLIVQKDICAGTPGSPEKGFGSPATGVTDGWELTRGAETEPRLSEEQPVFSPVLSDTS